MNTRLRTSLVRSFTRLGFIVALGASATGCVVYPAGHVRVAPPPVVIGPPAVVVRPYGWGYRHHHHGYRGHYGHPYPYHRY